MTSLFLLTGILLTPVFSIAEVRALISGALNSQTEALTPVYVKMLKDLSIAAIIAVGVLELAARKRLPLPGVYMVFIAAIALSASLSLHHKDMMVVVAGVRWLLPLLVFPFIYRIADEDLQESIARCMLGLFVLGFIVQVIELFYVRTWFGINAYGLNSRNPGFYLIPSSMACFSCLTAYYAQFHCHVTWLRRCCVYLLVPVSVAMTASASGVIALGLFYLYVVYGRTRQKVLVAGASILSVAFLLSYMPTLTGRHDIFSSLLERVDIFLKNIGPGNLVLSSNFGDATNTGILLGRFSDSMVSTNFIADSTITSVMYNGGMLSLFLFAVLLSVSLRRAWGRASISFFLLLGPFFVSTILLELFPANLLLVVNLAFFYRHMDARRGGFAVGSSGPAPAPPEWIQAPSKVADTPTTSLKIGER